MLNLKIEMVRDMPYPIRATNGSAGFDIFLPSAIRVYRTKPAMNLETEQPYENGLVPLGFRTKFDHGYMGLLLPRSGLGCKFGVHFRNTAGVIDADFEHEWMGSFRLNSDEYYHDLKAGERVAQIVFMPIAAPDIVEVKQFGEAEFIMVPSFNEQSRNGGFGSTGK